MTPSPAGFGEHDTFINNAK